MTLGNALRLCKTSFVGVGVFSGIANLLMLVPAFFMLNVYDKAVGNNSLETLWVLSSITVFLFAVLAAMEWVRSRVLVYTSSRLDLMLAERILKLTYLNAVAVGSNRATIQPLHDLNALRRFLTGNGVFAFFDAPWLPIYLLILFLFHPLLGWLGVVSALIFLALALANEKQTNSLLDDANQASAANNVDCERNVRNSEVATAMGMVPELIGRWRLKQNKVLDLQEQASNIAGAYNSVIKTLRLAVQSAAIAAGAYLVLNQEISPGMLIAGSILISRALQPVELAVGAWRGFIEARGQYRRLNILLTLLGDQSEKLELPRISGGLSACEADVQPPGGNVNVLNGVNFTLPAGATCMVVGPSGSGKSSLVRALLGLWPTSGGDIRIDGTESSKYDRELLGPQIGYLPQDIELLEGSVAGNIARFGHLDSEAIIQAATDSGIHEFILALPNGYDTNLNEQGGMLSAGQRQRVALARALYKRPRLVVLDEPNSNLDQNGEAALNAAISTLKQSGSTVVIVTHRKNVVPLADYMLVMDSGTVVDFGPARDVLARLETGGRLVEKNANASNAINSDSEGSRRPKTVPIATGASRK